MGQDPSVIRAEIEQTRERVGDEVDAISYKTDVGARASDYMDDKKEAVMSKVGGAKDTVTGVVPDRRALKRAATHMRETAASNPLDLPLVASPSVSSLALCCRRHASRTNKWAKCPTASSTLPRKPQARPSAEASRSRRRPSARPSTLLRSRVGSRARS